MLKGNIILWFLSKKCRFMGKNIKKDTVTVICEISSPIRCPLFEKTVKNAHGIFKSIHRSFDLPEIKTVFGLWCYSFLDKYSISGGNILMVCFYQHHLHTLKVIRKSVNISVWVCYQSCTVPLNIPHFQDRENICAAFFVFCNQWLYEQ